MRDFLHKIWHNFQDAITLGRFRNEYFLLLLEASLFQPILPLKHCKSIEVQYNPSRHRWLKTYRELENNHTVFLVPHHFCQLGKWNHSLELPLNSKIIWLQELIAIKNPTLQWVKGKWNKAPILPKITLDLLFLGFSCYIMISIKLYLKIIQNFFYLKDM